MSSNIRGGPLRAAARYLASLVRRYGVHGNANLSRLAPDNLFQPEGATQMGRYPGMFGLVRAKIGDGDERRLLSFGCSTGEEAFTLRRYFPHAEIVGIEIDPRRVARAEAARRARGDARMRFVVASSADGEPEACYDAIFAMAVFRHAKLAYAPPRCDDRIQFNDFDRTVVSLARALRPGGLLVVRHAMFRLDDSSVAPRFVPLRRIEPRGREAASPVYGPDNRLRDVRNAYDGVFRKLRPDETTVFPWPE